MQNSIVLSNLNISKPLSRLPEIEVYSSCEEFLYSGFYAFHLETTSTGLNPVHMCLFTRVSSSDNSTQLVIKKIEAGQKIVIKSSIKQPFQLISNVPVCGNCGYKLAFNISNTEVFYTPWKFCPNCGTPIDWR